MHTNLKLFVKACGKTLEVNQNCAKHRFLFKQSFS